MVLQYLDDVEIKLKEPYDLSFINKFGRVFRVFDKQSSGNLCFGVESCGKRYFLKFAGARTINLHESIETEDTVAILKHTVQKYNDLKHPRLINMVGAEEIGGGFVTVFEWFDGESCGFPQKEMCAKFKLLPIKEKQRVFNGILEFHAHVANQGYVAIDFNDQSTLYNFETGDFKICDIDFYAKYSYMNGLGETIGDPSIMSPEEHRIAGLVDEISNVYTMGATAFVFFADEKREREYWGLSDELYEVAKKAVSVKRKDRQQSIGEFLEEWRAGSE